MPRLNEEANDHMTNGRIVWRYLPADRFLQMISDGTIYLPTAAKYEGTDLNEGRFTDTYVRVVRNWVKQFEQTDITEDEEVALFLSRLLAAREASYISCWTARDNEDEDMWQTFGDQKKGIALKSTIGKVCDEFYDYCDNNEPIDLSMGLIEYDRMRMHAHLSVETIHDCHLPLFFLDGGQKNYIHEQEYRFIIYNPEEVSDIASDLLTEESIRLEGSIKLSDQYRQRISGSLGGGLSVPVNLEKLLLEIRFGSEMDSSMKEEIKKNLLAMQIAVQCQNSTI